MKAIIGRKMGMTEVFAADGTMYPVTVIEVLPNVVTQIKTVEKDGYSALQVGIEPKKESRANKPEKGHFAKAGVKPMKILRELKGDELGEHKTGDEITVDMFKAGDVIDVIGVSKGHGFSGTIKRYGHAIGPKGHGSGYHRQSGSFAQNGLPTNRVLPGKKMPGHHGNKSATIMNLTVIEVDPAKHCLLVRGGVPGPRYGLVRIRSAIKAQSKAKMSVKPLVDLQAAKKAKEAAAEPVMKEAEAQ